MQEPLCKGVLSMDPQGMSCLEEDPWRYCYKSSKLSEAVSVAEEWKAELQESTPWEPTTTTTMSRNTAQDKGMRNTSKSVEVEQGYKLQPDTFVEKV